MADAILDASAVLAVIQGEQGAEMVTMALRDASILAVNYAEVISKLVERGASYEQADAAVQNLAVPVIDFDLALARRTGALRSATRNRGLSLADRACLALGQREQLPVLTSDRRWVGALPDVEVQLIR